MNYKAILLGAITLVLLSNISTVLAIVYPSSNQFATDPDNGECLTTDGSNNVWSTSCGSSSTTTTAWQTVGTNVILSTSTNNVGIGTSTPNTKLVLSADAVAANPQFRMTGSTDRN